MKLDLSIEDVDALRRAPSIRIEHAAMVIAGHSPACLHIHGPTPGMYLAYAALAGLDDTKPDSLKEAQRRWHPNVASSVVSWDDIEAVLSKHPHMGKALRTLLAKLPTPIPLEEGRGNKLADTKRLHDLIVETWGSVEAAPPYKRGTRPHVVRQFLQRHLAGHRFERAWAQLLKDYPCLRPRS